MYRDPFKPKWWTYGVWKTVPGIGWQFQGYTEPQILDMSGDLKRERELKGNLTGDFVILHVYSYDPKTDTGWVREHDG